MIKPLKMPRGVITILGSDFVGSMVINENYAHRPDKILYNFGAESVLSEMINNNVSNTSPISLQCKDVYRITNDTFRGMFGR